jgi:transposase
MNNVIVAERDQMMLMPPSIRDWLPQDHLAVFVADIVDQLDLSRIEQQYRGSGKASFSPAILLSLLFYGYSTRVFGSRRIEQATYDSVAFRFLSGDTHPDHDTICTFRRRFLKDLKKLFAQILLIAREMGCAKIGTVAIDGTKVQANASKHKAMSWKYARRLEKQLRREIDMLLRQAEEADTKEAEKELDIPEEIGRREQRLAKIAEAKLAIQQRAAERHEEAKRKHEERKRRRKEAAERTGRRVGGKGPKPPKQSGPEDGDQHNFTDSDSRIMKSHGAFQQSYNAQAAVDVEDMLIVGTCLTNNASDAGSLIPTIDAVTENADAPGCVLADAGYFSEDNVKGCEDRNIDAYIAVGREKHNVPLGKRRKKNPPASMSPSRKMMWRKLRSEIGREFYRVRKSTVEPAFGIIKEIMGFRRFLLRGREKAAGEWDLVCLAYDIRRLHQLKVA